MKSIKIHNNAVEGECQIQMVYSIKLSVLKSILFFLLCLCTGGIVWVISYWLPQTKRKFLFNNASSFSDATHFLILNWDHEWTIVKKKQIRVQTGLNEFENFQGFNNRLLNYYYEPINNQITPVVFDYMDTLISMITNNNFLGIVDENKYRECQITYGNCKIDVPVPSIFLQFFDEICHPFFLFQVFSCTVWGITGYVLFACVTYQKNQFIKVLAGLTLYSMFFNLYTTRSTILKLKHMAEYTTDVKECSLRYATPNHIKIVQSPALVPGSVIFIEEGLKLPCDCVLMSGECLVDEVTLTGESMAVPKYSYDPKNKFVQKGNILYEGTIVVQSSHQSEHAGLPCLVMQSSFSTLRGQLIRSIMFPKPHTFKFFQESIYFIFILFFIGITGFFIDLHRFLNDVQTDAITIVYFLLNAFTIVIPPQLPSAMSFGVTIAIEKLKKNDIFCISPPKIIMSGRINAVCFDKTGTLTHEGVILRGIVEKQKVHNVLETVSNEFRDCMLCCQSLFNNKGEILGSSLELQLFEFVKGKIQDIPIVKEGGEHAMTHHFKCDQAEFLLLHIFQFSSDTQRMSVVVRNINTGDIFSFVKGAPEVIVQISKKESLKNDIYNEMEQYFQQGYRVLGFGYKKLPNDTTSAKAKRDICESELTLLGFSLFQNDIKPKTKESIEQLQKADIDCKIVTGDNRLIALSVAEKLGLVKEISKIILVDYLTNEESLEVKIYNSSMERNKGILNKSFKIKVIQASQQEDQEELQLENQVLNIQSKKDQNALNIYAKSVIDQLILSLQQENFNSTQYIFSGSAFEIIFTKNIYAQKWLNAQQYPQELREILIRSVVFARMKPNQKTLLVQLIQKSDLTVGMVGDGANDCGALKQADAGLALSNSEASISAPFTSKVLDISATIVLLRIGRAALATNFQCFKFIALYALIQFTSHVSLGYCFSSLADLEYLSIDLIIVLPYSISMALSEPSDQLSVQRPESSLFTTQCMLSVFGQYVFQLIAQLTSIYMVRNQSFYPGQQSIIDKFQDEGWVYYTPESDSIYVLTIFLYQASIFAFSIAKPFKKPFYTNIYFMTNLIIIWSWTVSLTFVPQLRLPDQEQNTDASSGWYLYMILYAHFWAFIFYLWENLVCYELFVWWNNKKLRKIETI